MPETPEALTERVVSVMSILNVLFSKIESDDDGSAQGGGAEALVLEEFLKAREFSLQLNFKREQRERLNAMNDEPLRELALIDNAPMPVVTEPPDSFCDEVGLDDDEVTSEVRAQLELQGLEYETLALANHEAFLVAILGPCEAAAQQAYADSLQVKPSALISLAAHGPRGPPPHNELSAQGGAL